MAKVRLLNGKPLMVGGKVALSDDCCCGTPGICQDVATITVAISGVTLCPGCVEIDAGGGAVIVDSASPLNGTFILTQIATASVWTNDTVGTAHIRSFITGCLLLLSEGDFDMRISLECDTSDPGTGYRLTYEVGSLSFFSLGTPSFTLSRPNDNAICGQPVTWAGTQNAVATGGSIVMTV